MVNNTAGRSESGALSNPIPDLEPNCGSWVCSRNEGERFETFSLRTAEYAAAQGYRVETAAAYLGRINREFRVSAARQDETEAPRPVCAPMDHIEETWRGLHDDELPPRSAS